MITPNYELLDELGRGGQAVVYRARQTSLDRIVALKVIQASSEAASDFELRLKRESRLLSRVDHPNLVKIFGSGELDGRPFLAMELVEGRTLKDLIESDPIEIRRRADALFDAILGAMEALHGAQLIHRDLKPSNIMVTPRWRAVVMDLGLGKDLAGGTVATRTGLTVGTPAFMAPEVILGEAASAAADVWALGCLYFAMHAGRFPFSGSTMRDLIEAITQRPPPDLEVACPHLTPSRKALLLRLLEKDRPSRPVDAAAVRRLWDERVVQTSAAQRKRPSSKPSSGGAPAVPGAGIPRRSSSAQQKGLLAMFCIAAVLFGVGLAQRRSDSAVPVVTGVSPTPSPTLVRPSGEPPSRSPGPSDLLAPPSPLPLSWRWRALETHRRVLKGGGEAASQLARKLYKDEGHILGREPMYWLHWMDLNRWLEATKDRPWPLRSNAKGMTQLTEKFMLGNAVSNSLKREPGSLYEMILGLIYTYPYSCFGWMLMGFCMESEGPASLPKAIRAYHEGLEKSWPPDVRLDKEEIWQLLGRALILVPGHDIEKEWWAKVPGPDLKSDVLMGLCRATFPDTELFLRVFEATPGRFKVTIDEKLILQHWMRQEMCNPVGARALLRRLLTLHPAESRIRHLIHLDYLEAGDPSGARGLPVPEIIHQWAPITTYYVRGPKAPDIMQGTDIAGAPIEWTLYQTDLLIERGEVTAASRLIGQDGLRKCCSGLYEYFLVAANVLNAAGPSPELEAILGKALESEPSPYVRFRFWNHLAGTFSASSSPQCLERLLALATCDTSLVRSLWELRSGRYHLSSMAPSSPDPELVGDHWYRSSQYEVFTRPLIELARGRAVPADVQKACHLWKPKPDTAVMVNFLKAVRAQDWKDAARCAQLLMNSQEFEPYWPIALSWTSHLAQPRADHQELDAGVRAALRHRHALWALREVP